MNNDTETRILDLQTTVDVLARELRETQDELVRLQQWGDVREHRIREAREKEDQALTALARAREAERDAREQLRIVREDAELKIAGLQVQLSPPRVFSLGDEVPTDVKLRNAENSVTLEFGDYLQKETGRAFYQVWHRSGDMGLWGSYEGHASDIQFYLTELGDLTEVVG